MTGSKTKDVNLGVVVGGKELTLHYDTINRPQGPYWSSNFHKSLSFNPASTQVFANRGSGVTFGMSPGGSNPCGTSTDDSGGAAKISAVGSNYQYVDSTAGAVESYDASGTLLGMSDAYGNTMTATVSDVNTPVDIAPAPGYLLRVADATGRFLNFTYTLPAGAPAATGGQLTSITDTAGRVITLGYNANGMLTNVNWPDGKTRGFVYDNAALPWALTGIVDENNSRYQTYTYTATGEAQSSELAGGVGRYAIAYAAPMMADKVTVQDMGSFVCRSHAVDIGGAGGMAVTKPNGQVAIATVDTSLGYTLLAGLSQPAGSGCAASNSHSTFDASGNIVSRDDFNGQRTCYAYDTKNQEIVRVEGLSNTSDCATVLPAGSTLPTGARKITTAYHPEWRRPTVVTAPGVVSTTVYHGQPDPMNSNALANCTSAPAMPNGKPLPLVCKTVTQAALASAAPGVPDAFSALTTLLLHGDTLTDSSPYRRTVTSTGNVTVDAGIKAYGTGSLNFDGYLTAANGGENNLLGSDYTIEFQASAGWVPYGWNYPLSVVGNFNDWKGAHIYIWRDATGLRGVGLQYFDGSNVQGLGVSAGNAAFDAALKTGEVFNHIAVTKSGLDYTFFLNGKKIITQTAVSQPQPQPDPDLWVGLNKNYPAGYAYSGYIDELRVTRAVRYTADFTSQTAAYADAIPTVDATVPASTSSFTYDAAGHILTAKDSLNHTTAYAYYVATLFTGTDPNAVGHTVGDLQSITAPNGFVTSFDSYDKVGRILQSTDPKGVVTQVTYTPRGWVSTVSTTAPGLAARTTTYTYDNVGQVIGVLAPDGTSTTMTYDAAHRLIGATDAKGNSVTYTLDNTGNVLNQQIKDPQGVLQLQVQRSFDALNRVQQYKVGAQ